MDHTARPRGARDPRVRQNDEGAAIVEFVFMSVLLVFVLFAVLQVAAVFFVRSVVSSAAADGARLAANANSTPEDGAQRASSLIAKGLSASMSVQVPCLGSTSTDAPTGLAVAQVRCTGRIKSVLIPVAAFVNIDTTGTSLVEQR